MKTLIIGVSIFLLGLSAQAQKVGDAAPEFLEKDFLGKDHKLSDYKGKYVVLEWFNKDCPFVKKHYRESNMQNLQKEFTKKGVVWLTVVSSAEGKQGHLTAKEAKEVFSDRKMSSTAVLLDEDGSMGKQYGAKVTPHMFIINPQGKLVYNGAIDDNNSSDTEDIASSKNYIRDSLSSLLSGKEVALSNKPYGCGVKYK